MEQELPTFPEHLRSSPVFSGVRVTQSLVLCVCFVNRCLSFWPLCFLSFFTNYDYPFGIFKLFLALQCIKTITLRYCCTYILNSYYTINEMINKGRKTITPCHIKDRLVVFNNEYINVIFVSLFSVVCLFR